MGKVLGTILIVGCLVFAVIEVIGFIKDQRQRKKKKLESANNTEENKPNESC